MRQMYITRKIIIGSRSIIENVNIYLCRFIAAHTHTYTHTHTRARARARIMYRRDLRFSLLEREMEIER